MYVWIHGVDICFIAEAPSTNSKVFDDTIILHNAKASDSAVYQCEASNRHGTLLSNANIMIMSKYSYFQLCFFFLFFSLLPFFVVA